MADTKIDVCNDALALVRGNSITNFTGASTESRVLGQIWDGTLRNLLSLHRWKFAQKYGSVSKLVDEPSAFWDAAYELPTDVMSLVGVYLADTKDTVEYEQFGRRLYMDDYGTTSVYVKYVYEVEIEFWMPYFRELMVLALAHKLSFALASKLDLKGDQKADFKTQFDLAKAADGQGSTTKALPLRKRNTIMGRRLGGR